MPILPMTASLPTACVTVLTGCAAALLSALILWVLLKGGLASRIATDVPNDRSLHSVPTPRIGGWGIVPTVVLTFVLLSPELWPIAVCTLGLAVVSLIDDRRGLPARVRFAAHIVAVVATITFWPATVPWAMLAAIAFLMLWLINLYNFMDGTDGLAGGMALFGFGSYAVAASMATQQLPELVLASAAVAGTAAGFLCFNFHPARVFLGDAGSITLGFLAGALGYWGWCRGAWPIWFPALTFSPFIADASVTLLRRLLRGEKFWQAHREHYYQRMVRLGMGHARTALSWYAVMFIGIIIALGVLGRPSAIQWGAVAIWVAALVLMGVVIDQRWNTFQSTLNSPTKADGDV